MEFISLNSDRFQSLFILDYQKCYELLQKLSKHGNDEVRKGGLKALDAFLKSISSGLMNSNGKNEKDALWYFVKRFINIFSSPNTEPGELLTAIKGISNLSKPCRKYFKESEVDQLLKDIVQKFSIAFNVKKINQFEHIGKLTRNIGDVIESIGLIGLQISQLDEVFINFIEKLFQIAAINFKYLKPSEAEKAVNGIKYTISLLQSRDPAISKLLTSRFGKDHINT